MNGTPGHENNSENETGEPIGMLADFQQDPSSHFLQRIRKRINRRMTAATAVAFACHLPKLILIEFLDMIFQVFSSDKPQKGDKL